MSAVFYRHVVNSLHEKAHLTFNGPNRAGETFVSQYIQEELSGKARCHIPFPGVTKSVDGLSIRERKEWNKLTVICTALDNTKVLHRPEMTETRDVICRYLEVCNEVPLQAMFEKCLMVWGEVPALPVMPFTPRHFQFELLTKIALNVSATEEMVMKVLTAPSISVGRRDEILSKRLPDFVWERLLFEERQNVADHPWCPPHLTALVAVAG